MMSRIVLIISFVRAFKKKILVFKLNKTDYFEIGTKILKISVFLLLSCSYFKDGGSMIELQS